MLKLFLILLVCVLVWMALRRIFRVVLFLGGNQNDSRQSPFGAGWSGGMGGRRGEKDITDRVRVVEERGGENDSARR